MRPAHPSRGEHHGRWPRRAAVSALAISALGVIPPAPARAALDERYRIGGEIRPRVEVMEHFQMNGAVPEANAMIWMRTRLHADARVSEHVFARVQVQDVRRWGESASNASLTTDLAGLTLREGYVELGGLADDRLEVRLGRQPLVLGAERLLGDLDWHWVGRVHDAAIATWTVHDHHRWSAFAVIVNENDQPGFTAAQKSGRDGDAHLLGIGGRFATLGVEWEPAWVVSRFDSATLPVLAPQGTLLAAADPAQAGDLEAHTFALRVRGRAGSRLGWELEGHIQSGRIGKRNLRAHALHLGASWQARLSHLDRLALELDRWSGDRDPGDAVVGTYQPAFPSYYEHTGILGRLGMKNLEQARITLAGPVAGDWRWRADAHVFRIAAARDDAWGPNGARFAATSTAAGSRGMGTEYDVAVIYPWTRHVTFLIAAAHFRPEGRLRQVIRNAGGSPTAAMTTIAQLEVKF